ncbi:MAG: glutamine synthetase [Lentisphaerae bacterium]|nr:glutamine synthetase [Lentisphaerota bacterium]
MSSLETSDTKGLLTLEDLAVLVADGVIDTILVAFTDCYGRLIGKRHDAGFFLEQVADKGSHACDYLLTVDMEMEPVPGYAFANWESGYGDLHLAPDMKTLRLASWLKNSALVLCDLQNDKTSELVPEGPRSMLLNQVRKLNDSGHTACAGSELEFYVFDDTYADAAAKRHDNLERAGWYVEDYHMLQGTRHEKLLGPVRRHLRESGVPVENSKGEWGVGQHELNVRYADVLEMADRHVIYKQCVKEVADSLEMSVTFMAKFSADDAGSSCHMHLSLWNGDKNAFAGDTRLGPVHCSDLFRWFLAGWIAHVPDVMVFYAPTVNSYKRYRAGSWAPTRLAWSYDNRTAGFRIVGKDNSLRIECRIPGADCNPYLAYAAALASGLDGIANKTEPPPMFEGDAYVAENQPELPASLGEATALFEQSPFARQAFGDNVVQHYAHFFRTERAAFDNAVTDWERRRYFERI